MERTYQENGASLYYQLKEVTKKGQQMFALANYLHKNSISFLDIVLAKHM